MKGPQLGPISKCDGRQFCGSPACYFDERHLYVQIVDCKTGTLYDTVLKEQCFCR